MHGILTEDVGDKVRRIPNKLGKEVTGMSKKLLAVLVGCALALCVGLVGCGGSGNGGGAQSEAPSPEEMLPGVWDIQNVDELLGESLGATDMTDEMKEAAMKLVPDICFMNINADGTFALIAFTQSIEGTWKVDGTTVTLESEGSPVSGTLEGDTFTLENGDMKMVLKKTGDEPRAVPTEEELQAKVMELAMEMMGAQS